jgi:MFS family permease
MGMCGPIAGVLTDRWSPRLTMITGAAIAAVGLTMLVPLAEDWRPSDVAWRLAVIGAGIGLFTAPNQTTLMAGAPKQMMATVGASSSLIRQLGLSLGPALATLTWALDDYRTSGMRIGLGVAVAAALIAGVSAARR